MIQNNPDIQSWRERLRSAPKIFLILFAGVAGVILVRSLQAGVFIFNPILLLPFVIMLGVYGVLFCKIRWNTRKSLLQLQERMLAGDTSLLAIQQPVPNEQALSMPSVIEWRRENIALALIVVYVFIVLLAILLPFLVFLIPPPRLSSTLTQLGSAIFGSFILILIVEKYSSWRRERQSRIIPRDECEETEMEEELHEEEEIDNTNKIDIATMKGFFDFTGMQMIGIDEEGFSMWTFEARPTIPWSEARLFCIVSGGHGPKSPLVYMLASEQACVKWVDAPSQSFLPLTWYRPALPDTVHQQKMQACLQVIAGKTGLPLYDLRGKL